MKNILIVYSILICILTPGATISGQSNNESSSQFSSSDKTFDSAYSKGDTISPILPPANKKFGIGLNPLRSVINIGYELQLRGAVSLYEVDRHAEISFPVQYILGEDNNIHYRVFYIEATYRRFPNGLQKGFYYSGGLRYAYIDGEELIATLNPLYTERTGKVITDNKIGIYTGIGYRHFSKRGFYWGSNIIIGIYFGHKTPLIQTTEDIALNWILGCDLLEIGYSF
jgi:hypothetical protein